MKARPSARLRSTVTGKRPWTTAADRSRSTLTRSLQDEIAKYERICDNYEKENRQLRMLITNLKNSQEIPAHLQNCFERRIAKLEVRVSDRLSQLSSIEKDSKSSRVLFSGILDDKAEKTKLIGENDRLVQIALHQEQRALTDRLKLRVYHDHRQLYKIRELFERAKKGEEIQERDEEDDNRRTQIHNLKSAIEYEKWRISSLQSDQCDVNEAASLIQKTFRGYLQRLKEKPAPEEIEPIRELSPVPKINFSTPILMTGYEEELSEEDIDMDEALPSEYEDSVTEEESDHVFDVTGVTTAEDAMYEEEQGEEEEEEDVKSSYHPDAPAAAAENEPSEEKAPMNVLVPPTIFDDIGLLPRRRLPAQNKPAANFPK